MLIQVQRQWIYLISYFCITTKISKDNLQVILINSKFLNDRISLHMDRIQKQKYILVVLLVDNFYNDLDEISKKLED
jgi:hypothetical protein